MTHFFSPKHDFWPIYKHLQRYYPLGLNPEESVDVRAYPGYQELEACIVEHIHNESVFQAHWGAFETELAASTGFPVRGTTYGQAPCFSAVLELGTTTGGKWRVEQELFFAVSLVGPFYTVLGRDQLVSPLDEHTVVHHTAFLTVSPFGAYESVFSHVCAAIEGHFAGYRFVPFMLATLPLSGLCLPGREGATQPLFYGLFNDQLDVQAHTMGERGYKQEDWLRPAPPGGWGQWKVGPPGRPTEPQVGPDLGQG
jgi:hypothetical protein